MNIAQVAPPWLALPPKTYGGTESVLSTLVEEQVAQGHEVALFASGDAKTKAHLASFFPTSLLAEGISWTMHLKAFYHLQKALDQVRAQVVTPTIDPFSDKNSFIGPAQGLQMLANSGIDTTRPLITQVSRFGKMFQSERQFPTEETERGERRSSEPGRDRERRCTPRLFMALCF